jgi:hypothetical protein
MYGGCTRAIKIRPVIHIHLAGNIILIIALKCGESERRSFAFRC